MAIESVSIMPHPDVVYYLSVQGWIALGTALFVLGLLGIILLIRFRRAGIKPGDVPWMIIGGALAAFLVFEAAWSFTRPTDTLTVDGDHLRVGSASVVLDGTTEVRLSGSPPALPDDADEGFARMPGAKRFPPFFTGGPSVIVKNGNASVSFKPVVYGPSGYLGANANPATDRLLARLAQRADGPAKEWLTWAARPAGYQAGGPQPRHSLATFYLIFGVAAVVVLGFLGAVNLKLARKRVGR